MPLHLITTDIGVTVQAYSATTVTGSGASGRVAYFDGTSTLTGATTFTFVSPNLTLPTGGDIRPSADGVAALNIADVAGTNILTFDTTNKRIGINTTGTINHALEVVGNIFLNIAGGSMYLSTTKARISANATTGAFDFNYNSGSTGAWNFWGGGTTSLFSVANTGQAALPTTGSGAGILIGGDVQIYRSAADVGYTPDKFQIGGEVELDGALNHDGSTCGFFGVAPTTRPSAYTPTNVTADRAWDCNATTVEELADVVATLVADLQLLGLVS